MARVEDLNQGDRIEFDGEVREVKHVALHPSGTAVVFKPDGNRFAPNVRTGAYLENAGWKLTGIRLTERV